MSHTGLAPPGAVRIGLNTHVVARWHEAQLRVRYPEAQVVDIGTRQAAREIAAQLFQGVTA